MRNKVMIALMLATSLAAMEGTIVSTAVPSITNDLSRIHLVSWVYAAYMLATAVSTPIFGKLADLFGRKKIIIYGIGIFLLGSALCGMAQTMEQLIICRAIQGIGAGSVMPVTMTIIGGLYTEQKDRAKGQGWVSAVWGISGVVGPLIGGFLVDQLSWRYIFYLNIPFGISSIIIILKYYKENISKTKQHIDYKGASILSLGTISILYALLNGSSKQDWGSPLILFLFIFSALSFFLFYKVEKSSPEPIIPLNLLGSRSLIPINMLTLFAGMIVISITVYLPIWSQGVLGKNATQAGLILTPMPVAWTAGSFLAGHLVGRISSRTIIRIGTIILIGATFLLFSISSTSPDIAIYCGMGLLGLGMGIVTPIIMLLVQSAVEPQKLGTAIGLNSFINTFSQTLGSAIFGMIFNLATAGIAGGQKGAGQPHLSIDSHQENVSETFASGIHLIFLGTFILAICAFCISLVISKNKAVKTAS
ncbi:MFS transporter [Bacillus sp. MUM 13]|uniref:MFS transporter n=1 Tax=Bacillus sp. MUM 13 TaxID=1678001 RepID=UPI0008F5C8E4|nr:MFS transporter [Bacillus sp. MUM 13]OIK12568.1 MFS transporter [Bacillus sp. MUM 13]